jgi:hypothetical protein
MARLALLLAVLVTVLGCDRSAPAPAPAPSTQSQPPPQPVEFGPFQCDVSVVAPLLPRRATHLTIDPSSNIYYLQETPDGGDTLFIIGADGVSNALPLSARSVLVTMDEKGTGNIQSIAAGADRDIYFFFSGGTTRKTVACFGRFETRTGLIRILAREKELARASDMGASLALARGSLVRAGSTIWLWLHHSDDAMMFNLRPGDFPREGEISLPQPTMIRSADGTLNLTRDELRISPGASDSIFVVDTFTAALWRIDLTGRADIAQTLVGLPKLLSTAAANGQGDIALFAAPSDPIEAHVTQRIAPVDVETHFPSLLMFRDGQISAIPRDDFHTESGFPLYSMQLDSLLYEAGRDSWIGYDSASGQIVRLRLSYKHAH